MLVPYVPNDMDKFFFAEPRKARGEAHQMSGMGGREKTGVNCVTGEGGL